MKKDGFIEGTFIATISIVLIKIMGLIYVIPFYAIIGTQGGALYAYAYNIYSIFLAISSAGIPIAISKIISEYNTLGYLEAKVRAFNIGKKLINIIAVLGFLVLFIFAEGLGTLIIGNITGGNTIKEVALAIRCISLAILVVPYLSISKGYLQGHNFIKVSSMSQIIEQVVRIAIILLGSYLTIRVFKTSISFGVNIAVLGAFFSGLAAIIYLRIKMRKNKDDLHLSSKLKRDNISSKEIFKKIIFYTIPYIVINIAVQIYHFIDMIIIMRVLNYLKFEARQLEFITSAVVTWSGKVNMIINALAIGMTTSLIPVIVSSFVKNDWVDVNHKINKSIEIIIVIAIPITIGISFLAAPVWSILYGHSSIGTTILKLSIFTALFSTLYLTVLSILQGLNKFKVVYFTTICGFLANAILDAPLMILFHNLGWPTYYGAIVATIIGYSISLLIALISIKKIHSLSYKPFMKTLAKSLVPNIVMILSLIILGQILKYNLSSRLMCLLYAGIQALIGGGIYLFLAYKMHLLHDVFGSDKIHHLIKKFTFGRVNIST